MPSHLCPISHVSEAPSADLHAVGDLSWRPAPPGPPWAGQSSSDIPRTDRTRTTLVLPERNELKQIFKALKFILILKGVISKISQYIFTERAVSGHLCCILNCFFWIKILGFYTFSSLSFGPQFFYLILSHDGHLLYLLPARVLPRRSGKMTFVTVVDKTSIKKNH